MLHQVEKIYEPEGTLSRITMGLIYLRSPVAGKIKRFALWFGGGSGVGGWKFDVRVAGVSQFPAFVDMLTLNDSVGWFDEIGGLSVTVAEGDIILLDARLYSGGPIIGPGTFLVEIDDEIPVVAGPVSSVNNRIAVFDGTTGALLKDGGGVISTDGTFASNSDAKIPTEKAIKAYTAGLGGAAALDDLTDVDTVSVAPTTGDVLEWNGTLWVPVAPSGGGGGSLGIFSPDIPYASPSTEDDEFNAGSLDAKWSTRNQAPIITFTVPNMMNIRPNGGSSTNVSAIQQSVTDIDSTFRMRVSGVKVTPSMFVGMFMKESTYDFIHCLGINGGSIFTFSHTTYTSGGVSTSTGLGSFGELIGSPQAGGDMSGFVYLEMRYVASSQNVTYAVSRDGINFYDLLTRSFALDFGGVLDKVGIIVTGTLGTTQLPRVDWFRRVQGAYTGGNV